MPILAEVKRANSSMAIPTKQYHINFNFCYPIRVPHLPPRQEAEDLNYLITASSPAGLVYHKYIYTPVYIYDESLKFSFHTCRFHKQAMSNQTMADNGILSSQSDSFEQNKVVYGSFHTQLRSKEVTGGSLCHNSIPQ